MKRRSMIKGGLASLLAIPFLKGKKVEEKDVLEEREIFYKVAGLYEYVGCGTLCRCQRFAYDSYCCY